jgi:hypothetical protein
MGMRVHKIDFVVVGAQKAGTTALRHFLGQHPSVGLVRGKRETHFFDKYSEAAARADYGRLHAMYSEESLGLCTGDVTPIYLYRDDCLPGVLKYNANMKVIVLLRDPSERAYSQWIMEIEKGNEVRRFLPALLHEARYFYAHGQHPVFSYIQRGFYDAQIARLQQLFSKQNYLILKNEDLRNQHAETLERVFQFLGVEAMTLPEPENVHSRTYDLMPVGVRKLLVSVFCRDIIRLEKRLGWDCSEWLK